MIAQFNQHVFCFPVGYEKPITLKKPSFILRRIRCFNSSRLSHTHKVSLFKSSTQSPSSSFANLVARTAKNDAQRVLCDYLHYTRNIDYVDAEHMSRNSPNFLKSLMSKINDKKDIVDSLTKFLQYSPINEFEPFFESFGLTPSKYLPLLPKDMIFLSDDVVLLENFYVLRDYGIPRIKMGKMYKEAKEIFEYDRGVLAIKLQAYENLGLSKPTVIKLVTCCPSLLVGGVNSHFANVIEKLKGLGIENDWIGGYLYGDSSYDWQRMLDTIDFFDTVGYSEDQMANLFTTHPASLYDGSGKKVYLLFGRLLKLGIKVDEAFSLFLQNSQFLTDKCVHNLLRAVDFLFQMGIEDIGNIVTTHFQLLGSSTLKGPKSRYKNFNVGMDGVRQIIQEDPVKFFSLASKSKFKSNKRRAREDPSYYLEKTRFLLRLGYVENSEEMTKALEWFCGTGNQLEERFDCLVKAGLDYNTVRHHKTVSSCAKPGQRCN